MSAFPRILVLAAAASLLSGCAFHSFLAKRTTPPLLAKQAHADTTDHIAYMGSDANCHYFYHVRLFSIGGSLKIPVSELKLKHTFPLGHGEPRVVWNRDMLLNGG